MKIPGLDSLLFLTVRALHGAGRLKTARDLGQVRLNDIRSILITVTTALGDSITFTPALTALREKFPKARIVGLYHRAFSDLYAEDPRLDRVIPYYGKYKKIGETIQALREESCELALLPYMNDPDVIPMVLYGGSRILFRMPGRNTIYSFLVVHPELLSSTPPPDHSNRRAADMVRFLGCDVPHPVTSIHIQQKSEAQIDSILHEHSGSPWIGLHPGASIPNKRWPENSYARLGKMLLDKFRGARILLTGSASERDLCERIQTQIRDERVLNLAGTISIQDMPALIRRMAVLISGDTGIAVMGYAVHCATVTLFWQSNSAICGPMDPGTHHRVIQSSRAEAITPEQVLTEASELIHVRNIR